MMRNIWRVGSVAGLALIAACAGESATPTQPAAPTVQSVTVTGPDTLVVGATAAFAATAAYSDGSSNAGVTATWQATPSAVCSVATTGVVSATGTGSCDVSATLGGVRGSKSVTINERPVPPATLHVITGVVREIAPLSDAAVRGAAIIPLGGPLDGQRFETDAAGRFTLPAVSAAGFRLQVKHDDFENEYVEVRDLTREAFFEVAMTPLVAAAGMVHETAPTTGVAVRARIEVIGGALAGSRFTADAAGGFTIRSSAPGLRLRFTADGYEPREVEIPQGTRDSALDIALSPEPGNVVARFSGANWCQQPPSPLTARDGGEARILGEFAVHHAGTVTILTSAFEAGILCSEFCDIALLRRLSFGEWQRIDGGDSWANKPLEVEGGYMYFLELRNDQSLDRCGAPQRPAKGSPFDMRLIHPR